MEPQDEPAQTLSPRRPRRTLTADPYLDPPSIHPQSPTTTMSPHSFASHLLKVTPRPKMRRAASEAAPSTTTTTTTAAIPIGSAPEPWSRRAPSRRRASRSRTSYPLPISSSPGALGADVFSSSLSSMCSFSSSSTSSSACSLMTVSMDEETGESSLSEPDFGTDLKRDPLATGNLVRVPAGCEVKAFVGEGSANVVVEIELPEGTPSATRRLFDGKLLRLQKVSSNPEKRPYPYPEQYQYWREHIKPLFPDKDELVSIDLVHLGSGASRILDEVDELLGRLDRAAASEDRKARDAESGSPAMGRKAPQLPKRKKKFLGSRLARVEYAMLVDDMRVDEKDGIMIEIKPKWLLQSPSAPRDALRCRNCAVRLHRRLKDPSYDGASLPCPLLMTSDDWEDRSAYVTKLFDDASLEEWYVAPLMRWFRGTPNSRPKRLIAHLRAVQERLDKGGPLGVAEDEDFRLAMTMRDCSVFLRVLKREGRHGPKVVARVADLDKKNSEAKSAYWRRTEQGLIAGGAYTASYRVDCEAGRVVPVRTGCLMERRRGMAWREVAIGEREKGEHNRLLTEAELARYTQ